MDIRYEDLDDDDIIPDGGRMYVSHTMMDLLDPTSNVLFASVISSQCSMHISNLSGPCGLEENAIRGAASGHRWHRHA